MRVCVSEHNHPMVSVEILWKWRDHIIYLFLKRRVRQEHGRVPGKIIFIYINEPNVHIYDDSEFMWCSSYNFCQYLKIRSSPKIWKLRYSKIYFCSLQKPLAQSFPLPKKLSVLHMFTEISMSGWNFGSK